MKCCPQCYHKSPNPEISHRLICSQCPHETCSASANNSLVSSCPKCRKGSLILNRPINRSFLLTCNHNKCHHTLSVVQSAVEVKRSKNKCLKCSAFKLLVSSNDEIYAANSTDYIESCVFCDDRFAPYIFDPREIGQLRQEPSDQYTRQESRTIERPDSHPLRDRLNIRPEVNHLRLFEKPKQGVTYGFRSGQTSGADPIQRREAKRKINQGIKNIKGQPNNEVDFNENRGIMEAPREFNRYNDHFQFLKFDKPYMARKERQEEGLSQHRMRYTNSNWYYREEEAKEFHQQSNDDLHSEPMKLEQTDESKMCLVNLPKEEKNCLVEYQVDRSEK